MTQDGPVADVLVGLASVTAAAMKAAARPLPTPMGARALIDTGASHTVINPQIVQILGLQPVGRIEISTPSTHEPVTCRQFVIDLVFGATSVHVPNVVVTEAPLGGQNIHILVGRDVLRHSVLVYNGYANHFTLSF